MTIVLCVYFVKERNCRPYFNTQGVKIEILDNRDFWCITVALRLDNCYFKRLSLYDMMSNCSFKLTKVPDHLMCILKSSGTFMEKPDFVNLTVLSMEIP